MGHRLATINIGRKEVGGAVPLSMGTGGSQSSTVAWAEAYLHTKWHVDPSSRLVTIGMGRKLRGNAVPPFSCG